jgi:alpha-amylase
VAGVSAGSALHLQSDTRMSGIYAGRIVGRNGDERIGGDPEWQPFHSGYRNYRDYAQGAGWKGGWVCPTTGFQQAPLRAALPIPDYTEPGSFDISDDLLN